MTSIGDKERLRIGASYGLNEIVPGFETNKVKPNFKLDREGKMQSGCLAILTLALFPKAGYEIGLISGNSESEIIGGVVGLIVAISLNTFLHKLSTNPEIFIKD